MEQIAIIGAGLIGRAWAMVFARAGHSVRIWDPVAGVPQVKAKRRLERRAIKKLTHMGTKG